MSRSIGIDFGTSTTLIARTGADGRPRVLPIGLAEAFMPSVLAFDKRGHWLVGEAAEGAPLPLRSVKRAITQGETEVLIRLGEGGRRVPVDEAVEMILRAAIKRGLSRDPALLDAASLRMGCPAMWDGRQRRRLAGAAQRLGLPVTTQEIVDEPVAAGVEWISARRRRTGRPVEGRVLVVDIGGGTLDVAVLDAAESGRVPVINVLSAIARTEAGDDLDGRIMADLRRALPISPGDRGPTFQALLLSAARRLKEQLARAPVARTPIDARIFGVPSLTYNAAQLDQASQPLVDAIEQVATACLKSAKLRERNAPSTTHLYRLSLPALAGDIHWVLLAGGTSQVPAVAAFLDGASPSAAIVWDDEVGRQGSVVAGLAVEDAYSRLNLHRPGFNVFADFPDGSRQVLYEAYDPLYEWWQILHGQNNLGRTAKIASESTNFVEARITCETPDGVRIPVAKTNTAGERVLADCLSLRVSRLQSGYFRLFVDGRVYLSSSSGKPGSYYMKTWPVLRAINGSTPPLELVEEPGFTGGQWDHGVPGEPG